jgi:PPOX class probable F420-dependent enzyme
MATLDPACRELIAGANFAHLATIMRDGSPHTMPVWIDVEDGRLLFYREEGSIGLGNLRRDPRVAISITDLRDPYRYCAVRGRVVEERGGRAARAWLDRVAVSYTGRPYPEPGPAAGVVVVVEPDRTMYVHLDGFTHAPPGATPGAARWPTGG